MTELYFYAVGSVAVVGEIKNVAVQDSKITWMFGNSFPANV